MLKIFSMIVYLLLTELDNKSMFFSCLPTVLSTCRSKDGGKEDTWGFQILFQRQYSINNLHNMIMR
jgi:hypothetical protein